MSRLMNEAANVFDLGEPDDRSDGLARPPAPRRRDLMAGARPRPIVPKSLSEAYRIAQAVCAAQMAPKGLDTPEACMIAIMHGLEVGLSPLAALQRIAVINGRPTIWGDGALALVKASGLCEAIDEWIEGDRPEDWVAVCNVIRRGDPVPVERRFSSEDAKRAKLWDKNGPWSDYPKRMLQMRARAFALRDAFPDVLGGLYLTEELLPGAEREPMPQSWGTTNIVRGANWNEQDAHPSDPPQIDPPLEACLDTGMSPLMDEDVLETGKVAPAVSEELVQGRSDHKPIRQPTSNDSDFEANAQSSNRKNSAAQRSSPLKRPAPSATHHGSSSDVALACITPAFVAPASVTGDEGSVSTHGEQDPNLQAHPAMPPLANLRRARWMTREVRAMRFRNQWSIRQPRGRKTAPSKPADAIATTAPTDDQAAHPQTRLPSQHHQRDKKYRAGTTHSPMQTAILSRGAGQGLGQESGHGPGKALGQCHTPTLSVEAFVPQDDITAHLDLYDAALCCATDPDTLSEIADEFIERLSSLPIQARHKADLIFEQHQERLLPSEDDGANAHE